MWLRGSGLGAEQGDGVIGVFLDGRALIGCNRLDPLGRKVIPPSPPAWVLKAQISGQPLECQMRKSSMKFQKPVFADGQRGVELQEPEKASFGLAGCVSSA